MFYLPPDGKVLNYWLVLALFSSEELKNQQKLILIIWLIIESWTRGLLNKTCNRNSVFVVDENFDTKEFKTCWTQVQLKNIYRVKHSLSIKILSIINFTTKLLVINDYLLRRLLRSLIVKLLINNIFIERLGLSFNKLPIFDPYAFCVFDR